MHTGNLRYVGSYRSPGRDARGRVASWTWTQLLETPVVPIASDDAADARWWPVDDVLADAELWAFADHTAMVRDARAVIERSEARDRSAERLTELFVHADLQWNRAVGDHETLAQPYLAMLARTALEELEGRRP